MAAVPYRFRIDKRNRWMINESQFVITHIRHSVGGAAKYSEIAKKAGKTVINII